MKQMKTFRTEEKPHSSSTRFMLYIALVFISFACGKSENKALIGEWQWVVREGGFAGVKETPSSTGNARSITIDKKKIRIYQNGQSKDTYSYKTEQNVSTNFGTQNVIKVKDEIKYLYSFRGDTLILTEPYTDGFTDSYVKN